MCNLYSILVMCLIELFFLACPGVRRHLLEELLDLEGRKRRGSSVVFGEVSGRECAIQCSALRTSETILSL